MRTLAVGALTLAGLFTGYAIFYAVTMPPHRMTARGAGMSATQNLTPPVKGLYEGREVLFIHTEASHPQVAEMLTKMMGPKVLLVPRLAKAPENLLADVYVFTNGMKGDGPFGFQVDVFSSIPSEPEYSPLRSVVLVTWKDGLVPRVLGSARDIRAAADKSEITLKRPGVVVNMPILTWPGGTR